MKLTEFNLFYDTPFTDFQNTIHFSSNAERDTFFQDRYNMRSFSVPFNFVKDRLTVNMPLSTNDTYGLNYCRFRNDYDSNRWYYAFIMNAEYVNDKVTKVYLVVDTVMTFTQGNFTSKIKNAYVKRQSLTNARYDYYRYMLANNGDTLAFPKYYTLKDLKQFKNFYVVFMSSVDLTKDFGDEDDPKLRTSSGGIHDEIVSPLDLYCCKSKEQFTAMMNVLSRYPWISQNISNVAIVPADLVTDSNLTKTTNSHVTDLDAIEFYRFNQRSKTNDLGAMFNYPTQEALNVCFGFPANAPSYLLRGEYANMELTGWNGQRSIYEPQYLFNYKFTVKAQSVFGYHNEIRVYVDEYKTSSGGENHPDNIPRGTYVNDGIVFDSFDDIPVLIDNYKLAKANSAHQREYNNSNQVSSQLKRIGDSSNSLKDRFSAALSLTTSLTGGNVIGNALSKFNSEYEYYRQQQAQFADLAISAPSVGSQSTTQSFNIAKGIYGVTVAFSAIPESAVDIVERYYNTFGFDFSGQNVKIEPIDSMPLMNYLQFSGNWQLNDIPSQFVQQLQVTFENGVKLWHNNNTDNPFTQDLIKNMG